MLRLRQLLKEVEVAISTGVRCGERLGSRGKCEYFDVITGCSINLLRKKAVVQPKCFLHLYKSDVNFVMIVVLCLPGELGKRDE
jgi:hypothetical protein